MQRIGQSRACPRALAFAVAALCVATSLPALAGGFYVARFGGELGHPTTDNPTALHYNPAGLALRSGHRLMLDGNIAWLTRSYTRSPEAIGQFPSLSEAEIAANSGTNDLSNIIASPFIGFVTDFGTGAPFGIGIGFMTPFGGSSVWDDVTPVDGFPGSIDGPTRWFNIEGTIRSSAITLAGAYQFEGPRLSLGLGLNLYLSEINTVRARNADGTDDLTTPDGGLKEGRSLGDVTGTDLGASIGLIWEAIEDVLWIGASYQSQPNFGRDMELDGTLRSVLAISNETTNDMVITQELPDVMRFGIRYQPMPSELELRLDFNYQRWSVFEQQCLVNTDLSSDFEAVCNFVQSGPDEGSHVNPGSPESAAVIQNLLRNWDDTWGLRLGASWWVTPAVELIAGLSYDSNAVPDSTQEPALPDFDKLIPALGANIEFSDWFSGSLTVINVFYFERDTNGVATYEQFQRPSGQPNSTGVYESNALVINIGLNFTFGGDDDDAEVFETPMEDMQDEVDDEMQQEGSDESGEEARLMLPLQNL